MSKKSSYIILALILLLAAILRLIHLFSMPFSYDELSALARTHYSSFNELIDKGVIIDAHPAGVQVFLYYWVKLFGYAEWVVKMPFIICGVAAIYYAFRIADDWYNSTVALVCATYLATIEYTVMYSQEARPYVSGLFFVLAMVFYWQRMIFKHEKHFIRNIALYILFSGLCAYNHHFSLLLAALVGFTGLFFIQRRYVWKYVVAGICIFVLYIPHLHIFFYQLNVGGIGGANGWLDKPKNSFIIKYIEYVFQFSRYSYLIVLGLICYGIYSTWKGGSKHLKSFIISGSWFAITFLIGFFYSVYINPVLQYSVLIFSFPFLLFCLFGWLPQLGAKQTSLIITIVALSNIIALAKGREYYTLFYKQPLEQSIILTDSINSSLGKLNCVALIQGDDSDKNTSKFYIQKYHSDTSSFFWLDSDTLNCFTTKENKYYKIIHFLEQQKKPYLSLGCTSQLDANVIPLILDYYPYLVKAWDFHGGNFFLFSKLTDKGSNYPISFQSVNGYEEQVQYWEESDKKFVTDSIAYSGKHSYRMDSAREWAPAFGCKLADMAHNKNDFIAISLEVYPLETLNDAIIVMESTVDGKTIDWRSEPVSSFIPDNTYRKWMKVWYTVRLSNANINQGDVLVKAFIWNKGKKDFYMDDFTVKILKGNPVIYGLFEKI
jgi:hypothetical protein